MHAPGPQRPSNRSAPCPRTKPEMSRVECLLEQSLIFGLAMRFEAAAMQRCTPRTTHHAPPRATVVDAQGRSHSKVDRKIPQVVAGDIHKNAESSSSQPFKSPTKLCTKRAIGRGCKCVRERESVCVQYMHCGAVSL